jgi:hypothetical protein
MSPIDFGHAPRRHSLIAQTQAKQQLPHGQED